MASKKVYAHLTDFTRDAHEFNRLLFMAKLIHQRARNRGEPEDLHTIPARMELGTVADRLHALHKQLEATIRAEVQA